MTAVAVPSHARHDTVSVRTLAMLADGGVPAEVVTVFVAAAEVDTYRRHLDPGLYGALAVGGEGLPAQRNAVTRHYPEGTPVVSVDDDVNELSLVVDPKTLVPVTDLPTLFAGGFALAAQAGCGLWGVYPVRNAMFMRPAPRIGLHFCIGQLFGVVTSHAPHALVHAYQKDDYERTLRWWAHDGAVVRLDYVACKSRMHAAGGLQAADQPDRRAINEADVDYLLAEFPRNVKVKARLNPKVGREIRLVT